MMVSVQKTASAAGKIILSGEYAVLFGKPGIAVPSRLRMTVKWHPEKTAKQGIGIRWEGIAGDRWNAYVQDVLRRIDPNASGTLTIRNSLPLGKGMGSSTALVVAIGRCILLSKTQRTSVGQKRSCPTDVRETILAIENAVNPGHSGIDFAVIWDECPVVFRKGQKAETIMLPKDLLDGTVLIDTGAPNETTPELIEWVRKRKDAEDTEDPSAALRTGSEETEEESKGKSQTAKPIGGAIKMIGQCSEQLLASVGQKYFCPTEALTGIIRDHHRAQVALGVVTQSAQHLITAIEAEGGAAKVIGAGGRTGGSGMVLALGIDQETVVEIANRFHMPLYTL